MATLQTVVDRITLDYLNRTDLDSQTIRAVQAAVRHYERRRFPWNEATTTLTCVTAQPYVSVPTDFLVLDLPLEIQYQSSANTALARIPFADIVEMNAVQGHNSTPTHYALRANQFHLALSPDSAYPIICHYLKQLPVLTSGAMTATNGWLSAAEDVIVYHAAKLMWANVLRNTEEGMKYYALETTAAKELAAAADQQQSGRITPTSF